LTAARRQSTTVPAPLPEAVTTDEVGSPLLDTALATELTLAPSRASAEALANACARRRRLARLA
jgi:hypothetical protein